MQLRENDVIFATLPKICQNCRMWACQSGLQQMLVRRSAGPLKLWCPWVHDEKLLAKDCSWVCGLHWAEKCCLLLPSWPTHPISFFSALLKRTRRLPPVPRRHLQGQEGSPETAELLCTVSAVLCSDHSKILEEDWDAQKLPLSETCARCCTWKGGSRLWQAGEKETRALNDYCLLFQIETILERHILHRNLWMLCLDLLEVLLRKWNVKHLYLVVCHFLSDSWLHFRNVFSFSELNQFGIL